MLRFAIPSDGQLYENSLDFLKECGLIVKRTSSRKYIGYIESLPNVEILFQRTADITSKVDEGNSDLGIVGLDRYQELKMQDEASLLIIEALPYGNCDLVLGIPDSWIDVISTADLADLSSEFRTMGRQFRIATKYQRLVEDFMLTKGINYYTLISASGAIEAAPAIGFADIIADISSSGVTLKENKLKTIQDGTIFSSQACIIGNMNSLSSNPNKLKQTNIILNKIDAYLDNFKRTNKYNSYSHLLSNLRDLKDA